jgi:hypothetical protein
METSQAEGLSMKDLTVLAVGNDPFRIDTPAGHRDGEWLATNLGRLVRFGRPIHLRGLHYVLVTDAPVKPNGEPYRNTDPDWCWLQDKAADAARWLGYVPFDRIVDQRNSAPVVREFTPPSPTTFLSVDVDVEIPDVEDLMPKAYLSDFRGTQPYKLVLVGEKSSLEPVLGPIAAAYQCDLYLPTGCMSDTLIHRMATVGNADGRPMVVLYFADCDPAGWNMGIEVARKLQAFEALGIGPSEWELHRVALTPDQVRQYGLPSSPLKATEKRAAAWQAATGVAQTEIDALAALNPDLLGRLASEAIGHFYDAGLDRRVEQAESGWQDEADEAMANLDSAELEHVRAEANVRLDALRQEIDRLAEQMQLPAEDVELPQPPDVPEPEVDGVYGGATTRLAGRLRRPDPAADRVQVLPRGRCGMSAERGRRGAGVNRSGATDTTMLIWKTINANPGITREEILAKIEDQIPAGWAKRRYINYRKITVDSVPSTVILERSRRHVLADTLLHMRQLGSITRDDSGGHTVLREIRRYSGNPEHVDHTGQVAAEHLNRAYAERTLRAAAVRIANQTRGPRLTRKEAEALQYLYLPKPQPLGQQAGGAP